MFLRRAVLGSPKNFQMHDNHVKSLRSIVTNLNTERTAEYYPAKEVVKRTTREWSTLLNLPRNGENARCDIVNGDKDRIVILLLVPRHLCKEVLVGEVSKDILRLNPLERGEARFRESIPGLPAIIQIDTSVTIQSQAFLDGMAMDTVWTPQMKPRRLEWLVHVLDNTLHLNTSGIQVMIAQFSATKATPNNYNSTTRRGLSSSSHAPRCRRFTSVYSLPVDSFPSLFSVEEVAELVVGIIKGDEQHLRICQH